MEVKNSTLSDIALLVVDAASHLIPFQGFYSELEAKGLNFDVYGPGNILKTVLAKFGQNHFIFEELNITKEDFFKNLFKTTYLSYLQTIPAIEAIWEEKKKKPKLIIADMFAKYARYLADKHGIPLLVTNGSFFVANLPRAVREEIERINNVQRDESLAPLGKEVEEKYGVSIKSVIDFFFEGDQNVSCVSKFVGDLVTLEKDGYTYLGPALRDETKSQIDVDPAFLKDKDLIYVSLGTAGPNIAGFSLYDTIIEAFKDTEHKILISATMGKAEELIAKGLPKNIIVKSWVPQLKVLEHSKLFISHVGAGGMMEALSRGVPMIAVPNFGDQPINANVVEKLNAGRWLKDKSPEGVKKLVEEVLASKNMRVSCQQYPKLVDSEAAKAKFIEIVRCLMK